jgi:23S rRNA pseudouridine1911/1915/1917 synthase
VVEAHPLAFALEAADDGVTLAAALRRRLPDKSWSEVRALCTTGKVSLDGERALDPAARVRAGQRVELRPNAPRPQTLPAGFRIALEDAHLVMIEKPSGISSVPYDRKETGTALDLIRAAWRRAGKRATATPLYTVHRIDKDTSGLIVFAKTRLAERALHDVFQRHAATRAYLAVAEGEVAAQRIESHLVADRGDGIRGSIERGNPARVPAPSRDGLRRAERHPAQADLRGGPEPGFVHAHRRPSEGQLAITYVQPLRRYAPRPGRGKSTTAGGASGPIIATLCRVRLETGRTHQIRIHLSERGHPLVGETVYIRDLLRVGRQPLPAPRLMLHAGLLGFPHPVTGAPIELRADPPEDFLTFIDALGGDRGDCRV